MATPVWPLTLPQGPMEGYTVGADPAVVAFKPDAGPTQVRPLGTLARRRQSTPVELTGTQRDTFDTFYTDTLRNGTLEFEWIDFRTLNTAIVRFADPTKAITWQQATVAPAIADQLFRATLDLEVMPS